MSVVEDAALPLPDAATRHSPPVPNLALMADKLAMSALPCPHRPTPPLVLNLTATTTKLGIRPGQHRSLIPTMSVPVIPNEAVA